MLIQACLVKTIDQINHTPPLPNYQMIDGLGVTLIDDVDRAFTATHVIAGDSETSLRRTPKLMIAFCSTKNIVTLQWLLDSSRSKTVLDPGQYLLLQDTSAESRYGISMKQTLLRGVERRKDGGLLAGWNIFFCDGVAGNKAPSEHELALVVRSAGGKVIRSNQLPINDCEVARKTIVITSHPLLAEQISSSAIIQVITDGAGLPQTTKWLFDCIMHQKLIGLGLN